MKKTILLACLTLTLVLSAACNDEGLSPGGGPGGGGQGTPIDTPPNVQALTEDALLPALRRSGVLVARSVTLQLAGGGTCESCPGGGEICRTQTVNGPNLAEYRYDLNACDDSDGLGPLSGTMTDRSSSGIGILVSKSLALSLSGPGTALNGTISVFAPDSIADGQGNFCAEVDFDPLMAAAEGSTLTIDGQLEACFDSGSGPEGLAFQGTWTIDATTADAAALTIEAEINGTALSMTIFENGAIVAKCQVDAESAEVTCVTP